MSQHSVNEAESHLSELIDRALSGEEVTITRDGAPVVALRPVPIERGQSRPRPLTQDEIEHIRSTRVPTLNPSMDAGALVSQMRDEDEERLS